MNKLMKNLEDPKRPLFGLNYWMLRKMGLILPDNKIGKFLYIFLHFFATLFVFTQYLELFVIKSNLDLVLTNLKISMLSIVCVAKANTYVFWQSKWKQLIDYISEADKYERDNKDTIRDIIIVNYTKYCRKVVYFYWFMVCVTVITVTNTPLLKYLSSSKYRDALRNGTESFPHIFSSWVPYDKYKTAGYWVTILYHTLICLYGGGVMNTKLFNSLLSPVMFLYVVMCSSMLCFSAYQLTTATNTTQKLLMAEYLIFGIMQLFLFCWHSNDVTVKSENVMLGPYESEWWTASPTQRKNIIILAGQLSRVHTLTAGPFTDLTLSTFVTILKGAYSYYTLLRK
nr:odorant receptor 26 [Papilio glaucus]